MAENSELKPVKELRQQEYNWGVYNSDQTGLQLVTLKDNVTGVTVSTPVISDESRSAAFKAWSGARQSRAPGTPWEIMAEMVEKDVDPDKKLEEMSEGYGHASVADMARLQVDFEGSPMHFHMALFNQSAINGGQEKSTRYQRGFAKASLHSIRNYVPTDLPEKEIAELETRYQKFGEESLEMFALFRDSITPKFADFYKPETASDRRALTSRVLDCARYALLLGQTSGMSMETSARDWSRIIGEMKASPIGFYGRMARQVEKLLTPSREEEQFLGYMAEAPSLIRHSEAAPTVNQNLSMLKEFMTKKTDLLRVVGWRNSGFRSGQRAELVGSGYSAGDILTAQYLSTIWPGLETYELLNWLNHRVFEGTQKEISKIIFNGHDNYQELPIWTGTTRGLTVIMESYLGEARDFNRHRGMRRFMNMPQTFGLGWDLETATEILDNGFGLPRYIDEIDAFKVEKKQMKEKMGDYYDSLQQFVSDVHFQYHGGIDYQFVINLLPLGHQVDLWMSGDPKQWMYFGDRRVRPGGHINYRTLAYDANRLIADSDPYLFGMRLDVSRPDPASREEFFDRS